MENKRIFKDHAIHALNDNFKHEVAAELGLQAKMRNRGWESLSLGELDSAGGRMQKRVRNKAINKLS